MVTWVHAHWAWLALAAGKLLAAAVAAWTRTSRRDQVTMTMTVDLGPGCWAGPPPAPGYIILLVVVPPGGAPAGWVPPAVTGPPGWGRREVGTSQVAFWKETRPGDPATVTITGHGVFAVKPYAIPP